MASEKKVKKETSSWWAENVAPIFVIICLILVTCLVCKVLWLPNQPIATECYVKETINKIARRLPYNDQRLATECYVDEKLKPEHDGYFFKDGEKINCDKVDESNTEVKIKYLIETDEVQGTERYMDNMGYIHIRNIYTKSTTQWLPKKKFYKYYTLEELSEIVNKR